MAGSSLTLWDDRFLSRGLKICFSSHSFRSFPLSTLSKDPDVITSDYAYCTKMQLKGIEQWAVMFLHHCPCRASYRAVMLSHFDLIITAIDSLRSGRLNCESHICAFECFCFIVL